MDHLYLKDYFMIDSLTGVMLKPKEKVLLFPLISSSNYNYMLPTRIEAIYLGNEYLKITNNESKYLKEQEEKWKESVGCYSDFDCTIETNLKFEKEIKDLGEHKVQMIEVKKTNKRYMMEFLIIPLDFIKILRENKTIEQTTYIERYKQGILETKSNVINEYDFCKGLTDKLLTVHPDFEDFFLIEDYKDGVGIEFNITNYRCEDSKEREIKTLSEFLSNRWK